jgi:hypothetical protein
VDRALKGSQVPTSHGDSRLAHSPTTSIWLSAEIREPPQSAPGAEHAMAYQIAVRTKPSRNSKVHHQCLSFFWISSDHSKTPITCPGVNALYHTIYPPWSDTSQAGVIIKSTRTIAQTSTVFHFLARTSVYNRPWQDTTRFEREFPFM